MVLIDVDVFVLKHVLQNISETESGGNCWTSKHVIDTCCPPKLNAEFLLVLVEH